jgi:HK97 family phage prohead protease
MTMTLQTFPIKGYASVFNVVDHHGDMMIQGAYDASLKRSAARISKRPIPLLWHHDPKTPIGSIKTLKEDLHGLYIEGEIHLPSPLIPLLEKGVVSGLSVGYKLHQSKRTRGITFITKVELFEVSLVTFPACEEARLFS